MNSLWAKYGCTKCSNYSCFVAIINIIDATSTFNGWIAKNNMKCPGIPCENGGSDFNKALNNTSTGSTYLIKPDQTFSKTTDLGDEKDFIAAGIIPHSCGGIDIIAPVVSAITTPASGAVLNGGSIQTITWSATDNTGIVSRVISFSSNGGVAWSPVDSNNSNSGTYSWTVPKTASQNCKIKITVYDAAKNAGSKESGVFQIKTTGICLNSKRTNNLIQFKMTKEAIMVYLPFSENCRVTISDINGKKSCSSVRYRQDQWYAITNKFSSGMHIIHITTPEKTIVKKFYFIR